MHLQIRKKLLTTQQSNLFQKYGLIANAEVNFIAHHRQQSRQENLVLISAIIEQ